ncbi:MAG: histidine kinase dimerization/phospho-acceptor domain-containing protein [Desulfuromonadaceae bacterium]|nr:histidine kinase dimerization/phospho-acceptor domain-containing protein [Desulfuromonadaceae bacterium]
MSPRSPKVPQKIVALAEGMADDFNNILTTVMGVCSLIDKDDPGNKELIQYVSLIRTSAERAAVLSDRLMHVATAEEKTANSAPVSVSVRDKRKKNDIDSTENNSGDAKL